MRILPPDSQPRSLRAKTAIALALAVTVALVAPMGASAAESTEPPLDPAVSATATPEPDAPADPEPTASPTATEDPTTDPSDPAEESDSGGDSEESDEKPDATSKADDAVEARAAAPQAAVPTAGRIGDGERYSRAVTASKQAFPDGAETVVIAWGDAEQGSLIAGGLAAQTTAPLLFTNAGSVPSVTLTELRRLDPQKIVVIANSGDITQAVYDRFGDIAPTVKKIRYASKSSGTRAVLQQVTTPVDAVYLSGSSLNEYALAAVLAASKGRAALLVDGTAATASAATIAALKATGAKKLVIAGNTAAVSLAYSSSLRSAGFTMYRKSHDNIYSLAIVAGRSHAEGATRAMIANPAVAVDVALATALAGATGQHLLYSPHACMLTSVANYIDGEGVRPLPVGTTTWLSSAVASNTSCAVQKPRLRAALEAAIRATAAKYAGSYAVTVRELGIVKEVATVRGSTRLEPASMMKLFAAWAALKRVQAGTASMSTKLSSGFTLGTCLRVMIHASDNFCHSDIVHWIGISTLNRTIAAAGFSNTSYGSVPKGSSVLYAGNRTTTNDLTELIERVVSGELLSGGRRTYLLNQMHEQIWRSRIASGIPASAVQRSKPGSLWIASGLLQADTATVRGSRSTFVLSIIGTDGPSKAALRAITRTVYEHFNGDFGTAASYPVQQMRTTKSVTMRSSPGGSSAGTIPSGRLVEVTDAQRLWYKIRYGGKLVWVDSRYLRNR